MQRVWTCTGCGWRSIAENVERIRGGFGRGEAPPHCRRCGGTSLAVTHEKHPKITIICKNPECRQDFVGWTGAKHCPTCQPKLRGKAWVGRRKYIWTPERDQILRDSYKSNATAFATRWGWPKHVVVKRAQQLGLCRVKEKPWSKAEDAFIVQWAGSRTSKWIARQLRTRTETAIVVRLRRMNISRRLQEGLTMGQLEQALGVDHRVIAGWVRSGRLPAQRVESDRTPQQGGLRYVFHEDDVTRFILTNPTSFRLDRVDQVWFMGLMREAVKTTAAVPERRVDRDDDVAPPKEVAAERPGTKVFMVDQLTACIGIDAKTACPQHKQVARRHGIPPRCPDCKLELRRRLQREEAERLQRIRGSAPPMHDDHLEERA